MRIQTLRLTCAAAVVAALSVAAPARADMYKWVDERGVTNYSSSPPAGSKLPKKVETVDERISVYTPDAATLRAAEPNAARDAKIASLEQQLEAERRARVSAAGANIAQAAYERCLGDRRVDCDGYGMDGYYPYAYAPYYVVGTARRTRFATTLPSRTSFRGMR